MEEQIDEGPGVSGSDVSAESFQQAYDEIASADNQSEAQQQPATADSDNVELQSAEGKEDSSEDSFLKALDPTKLPEDLVDFYKSMQGDYTRSKQKLAEERKQFEAELEQARQDQELLASLLGGEAEDPYYEDYTEDGEVDEIALLRNEIQELKAQRQAELEQQQQTQETKYLESLIDAGNDRIEELAKLRKHDLDPQDRDLLWSAIVNLGPDEHNQLQVEKAYKMLEDSWARQQQRWLKSKESQNIQLGAQGDKLLKADDFDDINDLAMAQYRAIVESKQ